VFGGGHGFLMGSLSLRAYTLLQFAGYSGSPKIHFLGLLSEFTLHQCMLFGMAASEAYVENGTAPIVKTFVNYLDVWIQSLK
jgi:hypothetical protein